MTASTTTNLLALNARMLFTDAMHNEDYGSARVCLTVLETIVENSSPNTGDDALTDIALTIIAVCNGTKPGPAALVGFKNDEVIDELLEEMTPGFVDALNDRIATVA